MQIFVVDDGGSPLTAAVERAFFADELEFSKLSPEEVLALSTAFLPKSCCFILSSFRGASFDHLRSLKVTIFGPQLVLDCLCNKRNLPRSPEPLFSAAMTTMNVCFTEINKSERDELRQRVLMMSGNVSGDLTHGVNVLVANSVRSQKYLVASERGIPVMQVGWINELWEKSSVNSTINPLDVDLVKFRLPILFGLSISVTGIGANDRNEISDLLERHGAKYMPELKSQECTHLIAKFGKGKKYLYALKWKIPVVSLNWLNDSIEKGYAQDVALYNLPQCGSNTDSSTPNNDCKTRPTSISSELSAINVSRVCETMLSFDQEYNDEVVVPLFFSLTVVQFIDFDDDEINEWILFIERHGGRVSNSYTDDEVTHRILKESSSRDTKTDGSTKHVSILWLQQCKDKNTFVDDAPFMIVNEKKDEEWDSMESLQSQSIIRGLFYNMTFYLHDSLESLDRDSAIQLININGGSVLTKLLEQTLFIVTSHKVSPTTSRLKSAVFITVYYLQKCAESHRIINHVDDFFFTPVIVTESLSKCLRGCVISFSGYVLEERTLLKALCKSLGGIIQDSMARKALPEKNILPTTHLIISKIDKQKYRSSLSWRIPAITKEWIFECVKAGIKVSTEDYLLKADPNMSIESVATDCTLNDTCLSIRSIKPSVKTKAARPKKPLTPPVDPNETLLPSNTPNITEIFVKPNEVISEVTQVIVKKHIKLKSLPRTPLNMADISYGNFDTPIRRMSHNSGNEIDMDNLRDILETPERYKNYQTNNEPSLTTPDFERALKIRMEMLNMEPNVSADLSDFSFSETSSSTPMLPLKGLVLYLSKSVGNASQMALITKIEKLGGSHMWVYEEKVTHVICNADSISDRNINELEIAEKEGKTLVSAEWITQCFIEFKKLSEKAYMVDLKDSVTATKSRKRRLSINSKENDMEVDQEYGSKQKQFRGDLERDALWQYSNKDKVETVITKSGNDVKPSIKKVIMLSSIEAEEREKYVALVERLGGEVLNSDGNISDISHLVCSTPGRGEKFLAAVAAGKWIVHKSYLDAVERAEKWIEEGEFEFGGPNTSEFLNNSSTEAKSASQELNLAAAANRWREIGGGAFKEWIVGIVDSAERSLRLGNIIECGGGEVVSLSSSPDPREITHLLINTKKYAESPVDLERFQCYKVELIQYILTAKSNVEIKKYTKKLMISPQELCNMKNQASSSSEKRTTRRASSNRGR